MSADLCNHLIYLFFDVLYRMLSADHTLTSPNYPGYYAHRRFCKWEIRVTPGRRITLTFNDLDIEEHERCRYDAVMVSKAITQFSVIMGINL